MSWAVYALSPLPGLICFIWLFIALVSENASASFGSACASATPYRRAEDDGIAAIVVPKFELRNVERQIFAADLVISAEDPRLRQ
jgi:hypothetical protein